MKMLRKVLGYAAMATAVTVGGVVVGAVVIAPAISRGKPLFDRTFKNVSSIEGSGGPVGQADGDPMNASPLASVAAGTPFKSLAEVIAADQKIEQPAVAPRRTGFGRFKYEVTDRIEDVVLAAGRVPKIFWVYADIGAVLLMAAIWLGRRRRSAARGMANVLSSKSLDNRLVSSLPSKLLTGKGSRTPKAVATLAQAGNSPADIARRTGLALDAVAMLISMGALGARQLQPPTA